MYTLSARATLASTHVALVLHRQLSQLSLDIDGPKLLPLMPGPLNISCSSSSGSFTRVCVATHEMTRGRFFHPNSTLCLLASYTHRIGLKATIVCNTNGQCESTSGQREAAALLPCRNAPVVQVLYCLHHEGMHAIHLCVEVGVVSGLCGGGGGGGGGGGDSSSSSSSSR